MSTRTEASTIIVELSVAMRAALAGIARATQVGEEVLVQRAISDFVQLQQGPPFPRFARRLGPLSRGSADRTRIERR